MTSPTMSLIPLLAALLAASLLSARALAKPPKHKLGDHPAVVVQRLQQHKGYDYASRFYPHPAWLYLRAAPAEVEQSAQAPALRVPIAPLDELPATTAALRRDDVE